MDPRYSNLHNELELQFAVESVSCDPNTEMYQQPIHEQSIDAFIQPSDVPFIDYPSTYNRGATLYAQPNPPPSASSSFRSYSSSPTALDVPIPSGRTSSRSRRLSPRHTNRTNGNDHFDEFEADNPLPELPPNPTKEDMEAYKKKKNTRSAKISRLRKNIRMQRLQEQNESLKREKEEWRTKANILRGLLISHGISYPEFKD